jgi:hypothetical protein
MEYDFAFKAHVLFDRGRKRGHSSPVFRSLSLFELFYSNSDKNPRDPSTQLNVICPVIRISGHSQYFIMVI